MNEREFIFWLQGFVQACNSYAATPKQWEELREKLSTVKFTNEKE